MVLARETMMLFNVEGYFATQMFVGSKATQYEDWVI